MNRNFYCWVLVLAAESHPWNLSHSPRRLKRMLSQTANSLVRSCHHAACCIRYLCPARDRRHTRALACRPCPGPYHGHGRGRDCACCPCWRRIRQIDHLCGHSYRLATPSGRPLSVRQLCRGAVSPCWVVLLLGAGVSYSPYHSAKVFMPSGHRTRGGAR